MTTSRITNALIGTYAEYLEDALAVHEGRASELFPCPVDGSLQGITRRHVVPGHPQGFDGGEVITLRCGHQLI